MKNFEDIFRISKDKDASDIHFKVGNFVTMRIHGNLQKIEEFGIISIPDTQELAKLVLKERQLKKFNDDLNIDAAYGVRGVGRFRMNFFYQRGTITAAARRIPSNIPSLKELNLPDIIGRIAAFSRGLIIVTGITGSGKSTTVASIIDLINHTSSKNIITIEDPIEYLFRDNKSIISQRQIGNDVLDFNVGLKSALRGDPDIIMIGEMRDRETIKTALLAAETGHLVVSTLHTLDAKETVNRIISAFPIENSYSIRHQIANVIQAVISQRLLKRSDISGMIPALEILLSTEHVRECIMDQDKTGNITHIIELGHTEYGMQTFDQSIMELYRSKHISRDEAILNVSNLTDFELKLKGVTKGLNGRIERF